MSKSRKNFSNEEGRDFWDEDNYGSSYIENKEKRKNKRLVNVLRSKNIQDLLSIEEDDF
jgi:hypothetical protein